MKRKNYGRWYFRRGYIGTMRHFREGKEVVTEEYRIKLTELTSSEAIEAVILEYSRRYWLTPSDIHYLKRLIEAVVPVPV